MNDFQKTDIRVGKIISVEDFQAARKPSYKLTIDFGPEIGKKTSSAQIATRYTKEDLIGKRVVAVVNLPPRQIGPFVSEVLTLGVPDVGGECILVVPQSNRAIIGGRVY